MFLLSFVVIDDASYYILIGSYRFLLSVAVRELGRGRGTGVLASKGDGLLFYGPLSPCLIEGDGSGLSRV